MKILLIEDDIKLCEALKFEFINENFDIDICNDGEDGLTYILNDNHDLIILDRMLPSLDGISILKKAREAKISTPIIMLTALSTINDRILGLDTGADDYVIKPFDFQELMARIRCITRRPKQITDTADIINYLDISYEENKRILSCGNNSCSLSKKEGALFSFFLKYPNSTLSREKLLSYVWGSYAEVEDGNLDNYIYLVRRRLKSIGSNLTIKTIRGIGYRLEKKDV
ncbi:response regulator transcription factor [Clostridium sp. MSJ-8]|uniref:response regulator transcription factor n=1 Tax=Clostridium sp. MSJ-8 TaxID=2841510 RepID=UPI001C0F1D62|nr:response regulator transcription factor [Clostridium sp. MSJ-8]MBU5488769.1 response regulator transcription factor [Clostridium sp. MSJ-8]